MLGQWRKPSNPLIFFNGYRGYRGRRRGGGREGGKEWVCKGTVD